MRADVEGCARRVLGLEATRSMGAGRLRDRISAELGTDVASTPQLMRDLRTAPGFLVLDAPVALTDALSAGSWGAGYEAALRAALADTDARVVLAEDLTGSGLAQMVARSVIALAAVAADDVGLRQALNAALVDAEAAERVIRAVVTESPAPAAEGVRSTTRPRDPPPPLRSRPLPPRRSSRRPLREGSH